MRCNIWTLLVQCRNIIRNRIFELRCRLNWWLILNSVCQEENKKDDVKRLTENTKPGWEYANETVNEQKRAQKAGEYIGYWLRQKRKKKRWINAVLYIGKVWELWKETRADEFRWTLAIKILWAGDILQCYYSLTGSDTSAISF